MMTKQEQTLWNKINEFELDDPDSSFTFSDRLSRENGWTLKYSLEVIDEYKKFIFLIAISTGGLTPSDQVDQVWHLHLLYTQSYWKDMCEGILGKEIHHGPTRGVEQRGEFVNLYQKTKELYIEKFGLNPPKKIWPSDQIRFSEINFQRVNLHRNWLIPKTKLFKSKK